MYKDGERMMAWITKIDNIQIHPNADLLDICTIGGWKCVTKKNEFKKNDLCIYISIDSWIPHELAPFLTKAGQHPKTYNGVLGQRLKTIRLRGQLSQGLLLPIVPYIAMNMDDYEFVEGQDVGEALGVQKWEPPVDVHLQGLIKGNFPHFIRKTDQERAQNLHQKIFYKHSHEEFEVTLKLDGSSMTVFRNEDELGVCSRNIHLKLDQEGNTFVDVAMKLGILSALEKLQGNYAVQGELMGPGIQGNRENLKSHEFYLFDIFDIDQGYYLDPLSRGLFFESLQKHGASIKHVPIVEDFFNLSVDGNISTMEDLLKFADGASLNHKVREGLVFKSYNSPFTFKVISNEFLLKEK